MIDLKIHQQLGAARLDGMGRAVYGAASKRTGSVHVVAVVQISMTISKKWSLPITRTKQPAALKQLARIRYPPCVNR